MFYSKVEIDINRKIRLISIRCADDGKYYFLKRFNVQRLHSQKNKKRDKKKHSHIKNSFCCIISLIRDNAASINVHVKYHPN